jgi:uncharacterized RDD family membrane protein YckC
LRRLRPVTLPKAGRVQRGLAWSVDLALAFAALVLMKWFLLAASTLPALGAIPFLPGSASLAGLVLPLLVVYGQARWKTTPGKRLFQLRIVDAHGLTPPASILAGRMAVQLLPIWILAIWPFLAAIGLSVLAGVLSGLAALGLLADGALALVRRDGRSIHDRFFATRVVLDAGVPAR